MPAELFRMWNEDGRRALTVSQQISPQQQMNRMKKGHRVLKKVTKQTGTVCICTSVKLQQQQKATNKKKTSMKQNNWTQVTVI